MPIAQEIHLSVNALRKKRLVEANRSVLGNSGFWLLKRAVRFLNASCLSEKNLVIPKSFTVHMIDFC